MEQSAVKDVRASLNARYENNWATNVAAIRTVKSQNTIETDVSTVAFKSALQWACVVTVSQWNSYKFINLEVSNKVRIQ